jgi:hypothetical protein
MKKVKQIRKGSKTYSYWMASWREDGKTRNVLPGELQEDECRRSSQEGQGDEGGGAGLPSCRRRMIVPDLESSRPDGAMQAPCGILRPLVSAPPQDYGRHRSTSGGLRALGRGLPMVFERRVGDEILTRLATQTISLGKPNPTNMEGYSLKEK